MEVTPLISICIPTYNGEKYIEDALNSLVNQTYKNFEVIISDDESSDNTLKKVSDFSNRHSDITLKIFNHKRKTVADNWNNCIKNANGTYIKFVFQDDTLEPNCLEEMLKFFIKEPKISLVASKRNLIIDNSIKNDYYNSWISKFGDLHRFFSFDNNEYLILDNTFFKESFFLKDPRNKIGEPSTVMFKKEVINKVGYFDTNFTQSLDYIFYYKLLKNHSIGLINKKLVNFRIHNNQLTQVNKNKEISDYDKYLYFILKQLFWKLSMRNKYLLVKSIFFGFIENQKRLYGK